ncbi:MAG: glycosyltransferase [Ignavibacteriaceae bacterium]|nr:glycosyltransferase [Ignavibacteriaceae bacterium]
MNRKKILVDLRFFHPGASGGIENYAYFVLDSLKLLPVDIYIEVPFENLEFYKKRFPFIEPDRILIDPVQKFISQTVKTLTLGKKDGICVVRKIKSYNTKFDFVFYPFHMMTPLHDSTKIIAAIHALLPETYDEELRYVKVLAKNATALITSWNYPMQEFLKFFPERKKDWFLIPFISAHNVNETTEEVKELVNKKYLLYVSFFGERKNHKRLIKGYKLALGKNKDIPLLVLVGGGVTDVKESVKKRIRELNLNDQVLIYDYLPDAKINFLYKNCYGVIAPTLWEAASGAVLEGVYSGKPILCSNVPPLTDFAEYFKLQMLFFDPLNINDMTDKIIEFCEKYDYYNSFSLSNAEKLKHIGHKHYAEKVEQILNKYST